MKLKTEKRIETERRWRAIYTDFCRLYVGGAMKMPVYQRLSKKYGVTTQTIMRAIRTMKEGEQ